MYFSCSARRVSLYFCFSTPLRRCRRRFRSSDACVRAVCDSDCVLAARDVRFLSSFVSISLLQCLQKVHTMCVSLMMHHLSHKFDPRSDSWTQTSVSTGVALNIHNGLCIGRPFYLLPCMPRQHRAMFSHRQERERESRELGRSRLSPIRL